MHISQTIQNLVHLLPKTEGLNEHWFTSLRDARQIIEDWRIDYNTNRPHSGLDYATPSEFASRYQGHAPDTVTNTDKGIYHATELST